MQLTPNYNLKKPDGTDNYNVANDNANMDTIDSTMKSLADADTAHKTAAVLDHPDGSVTTAKLANGAVTAAKVAADVATQAELDAHTTRTDNPHAVTAAQLGALPASSYTAADVLAKIKTVDGAGSGLDADLFNGSAPSSFARTRGSIGTDAQSNTTLESGIYTITDGAAVGLTTGTYYHIINMHHFDNNGYNAQIAVELNAATNKMFFRTSANGTWSAWMPIWTSASLPNPAKTDAANTFTLLPTLLS